MKQTAKCQRKNRISKVRKTIFKRALFIMLAMTMLVSLSFNGGIQKTHAAAYNAQAAINYARQYANGRNPQYAYYSGNDCSNFVSQCLTAGGLPHDGVWNPNAGRDPQTGYNDWTTTALKDYLINKGYRVIWNPSPSQILPGNPVFYSTRADYGTSHTGTNHAAICVSNSNGNNPLICAHTTNRLDYPHSYMMSYYKGCCTILLNGNNSGSASNQSNPGSPYPIPSGNLRSGSSGDSVKWVQTCVNDLLGAGISVDGKYGNQTIYAVKQFQQRNGLTVDGIVGTNTTNKMLLLWRDKKAEDAKPKDTTKPAISNIKISEVSLDGYRVTCNISDNVGITSVKFPSWTHTNGQDDLIWHQGSISGNTATCYVKRSDHKDGFGIYATHIYAYDAAGNYTCVPASDVKLSQLNTKKDIGTGFYAVIKNKAGGTVLTNTSTVSSDSTHAGIVKANSETGRDSQLWYFEKQNDGSYTITSKQDRRNLDYREAKDTSQNTVWAYNDNGTAAQRWYLYEASSNIYYLQGKNCENTLLEISGGSTAQGGTVHLYELNKSNAQQFYIQRYYQVTFKNGGNIVKTEMVKEGADVSVPSLSKEGYTLSWDKSCHNVKQNITVNAVWSKLEQEAVTTEKPVITEQTTTEQTITTESLNVTQQAATTEAAAQTTEQTETTQSSVSTTMPPQNSKDDEEIIDGAEDEDTEDELEIDKARIKAIKNVKKKSIRLSISRLNNVDGYEISFAALDKKALKRLKKQLKNADTETISINGMKKAYAKSKTVRIKNLKKNKTYYVVVRGYKVVDGKRVYGEYSRIKSIRIRK